MAHFATKPAFRVALLGSWRALLKLCVLAPKLTAKAAPAAKAFGDAGLLTDVDAVRKATGEETKRQALVVAALLAAVDLPLPWGPEFDVLELGAERPNRFARFAIASLLAAASIPFPRAERSRAKRIWDEAWGPKHGADADRLVSALAATIAAGTYTPPEVSPRWILDKPQQIVNVL